MKTKELETTSAGSFAWAAAQDAMRRNENNKCLYTAAEKTKVAGWQSLLDYAYSYKEMFVNYRQKFIVIKIDAARVKDAVMLRDVEAVLESYGVTKSVTAQGVLYRYNKV